MRRSRPRRLSVPRTAATCPWGRERTMSKASWSCATAIAPCNRVWRPWTGSDGHLERLARVRLRTLPPSRKDSRSKIAGGELRLGTRSIYMNTKYTNILCILQELIYKLHGYDFE